MTSKERSWGRQARTSQPAACERRRGGWRAQRCSTRVQVHRAGRSTFAWRAKGTAWIFILTVERGCQVWEKKRGGERPVLSAANIPLSLSLSFSPPLIRVRFFRWQSLENRDSLFLSPPLSLSLRFHAFPAGSELLFAREPRCRPLCLASVCILIVGPPLSFVPRVARREEGEERERERERDAWSTRERSLSKQRFNDRGSFHGRAFFRGNEFHRRVSSS